MTHSLLSFLLKWKFVKVYYKTENEQTMLTVSSICFVAVFTSFVMPPLKSSYEDDTVERFPNS